MQTRIFLLVLLAVGACLAQTEPAKAARAPERKFYHLDFVIKELDSGKTINARAYAMTVATDERTSIRSGNKLPVPSEPPASPPATPPAFRQYSFVDVGTNIDCAGVTEMQNLLALHVTVEISSVPPESEPQAPGPTIRQVKWSSPVVVPLRKPTVVFSSDDPTSKHQMQLELTASPIK